MTDKNKILHRELGVKKARNTNMWLFLLSNIGGQMFYSYICCPHYRLITEISNASRGVTSIYNGGHK